MRTKKRGRVGLALGAAALVALTACGPAHAAAQGTQTIELWESHAGGPVANAEAALVQKFNQTHRDVQVKLTVTKASTKALAALQTGNPPLLAEISHYDGPFLRAHALQSLNSFIEGSQGLSATARKDIYPGVWSNGEVNGQHYRLLADVKVSEFFYNERLFQKAGIQHTPTTWSELATDLVKLKRLGVIPLAFKDASAHIEPAFISNGGALFKSGSNNQSTEYNSKAGVETFSYFHDLYSRGLMTFAHGASIRAELAAGKLAIGDATSAGYAKALAAVNGKFTLGAFAYPKGISGHSGNISQGLGFVIFTHHSQVQQQAAWSFIKWFDEPQQMAYWAMQTGFDPVTKGALRYSPSAYLKTHPGLAVSLQEVASPYTVPRAAPDAYAEVEQSLDAAFFKAVKGQESIAQALSQLDQQAHQYLLGHASL